MSENIQISIPAGRKYLLETAGKICDKNIVINAGTVSTEGTAIPVGQVIDELYLGTHLDKEYVDSILSQLTFYNTELFEYPIHCCYFAVNPTNTNEFFAIIILHEGEGLEPYTISALSGDVSIPERIGATTLYSMHAGWNVWLHTSSNYWDFTGCLSLVNCGSTLFSVPLAEFAGIPIGLENEKIKDILSITPFVSDRYEDGKKAEYDAFWDVFQQNGTRDRYNYAFSVGWNDNNFKPKYDIVPSEANSIFFKNSITSLTALLSNAGITLDLSNCANASSLFADCISLTDVPHIDLSSAGYCGAVFSWCISLKTAEVTFSEKNTDYYNAFFRCDSLENLTVHGTIPLGISLANSSKLTATSVQSIIDHLKDLTGKTSQTLTFHATVGANLAQAQKDAITAKNWQLVY